MDLERTATCMAALGNVARLRLFSMLVTVADDGMSITDLRKAMDMPASTLVHHLGTMVDAGLVRQERVGREVICRPDLSVIGEAWRHFQATCCAGSAVANAGRGSKAPAAAESDARAVEC